MNRIMIIVALFCVGCQSIASDKVQLTVNEAKETALIVDQRERLYLERSQATVEYQQTINALAVREGEINTASNALAFRLKKAHKVPVGDYQLDEQHAVLVKVK